MDHSLFPFNRRAFLGQYAGAIGTLALSYLLDQEQIRAGEPTKQGQLAPMSAGPTGKNGARAKSVICLFQHGGPSQMDLFDPKPALTKHHGQPYPGKLEIHFDKQAGKLLSSPFRFRPHGHSGTVLSELLPRNVATQIFRALLENNAGFYASQMTAMDSATRNAGDMIDRLTLNYNRTRQAQITKELIEIISGAEAV